MSRFFRENFHKITLLLTAVFWANCGAAEESQDTTNVLKNSSAIEKTDSTKKDTIVDAWFDLCCIAMYYGISAEDYSGPWDPVDDIEYIFREYLNNFDDKQKLKR